MSAAQENCDPRAAEVRDTDVYLGESLQELVDRLRNLRERLVPFLVPDAPSERPMNDAKIPEKSALEKRLVWLTGQIVDAEEILTDINTRLYIPATIDLPKKSKKMEPAV